MRRIKEYGAAQVSIFHQMLGLTNLDEMLTSEGHITVFAPTDAAFKRAFADVPSVLAAAGAELQALVRQHIVPQALGPAQLVPPLRMRPSASPFCV